MVQHSYENAEDLDWFDEEDTDLTEVLRDALDDVYADADPEEMDDALDNVLESMTPAESFNSPRH